MRNDYEIRRRQRARAHQEVIAKNGLPPVTVEEVNAALLGWRHALEQADLNFSDPSKQERALREVALAKLRYEEKASVYKDAQAEAQIESANELARTNTQIAGSQMWIAYAIGLFTFCQMVFALLQWLETKANH